MSKRRYEGEQTKKDIANKAKILFSQKGYAATSMEDICNATGRSIGNIYYHFKSKEDLFLYLVEQTFMEGWEQWEKISSQYESITEKLYAFSDHMVDNSERPLNTIGGEFLRRVGADSEAGKRFLTIAGNAFRPFEELVSEGIASGELKNENPKELAIIVFSIYTGLSHLCNFMDDETKKAFYRKGTTLLLQGISTRNDT